MTKIRTRIRLFRRNFTGSIGKCFGRVCVFLSYPKDLRRFRPIKRLGEMEPSTNAIIGYDEYSFSIFFLFVGIRFLKFSHPQKNHYLP